MSRKDEEIRTKGVEYAWASLPGAGNRSWQPPGLGHQDSKAWDAVAETRVRTKGKEYSGMAARHALVALRYSVALRARVAPCQHSGSSSQMACA